MNKRSVLLLIALVIGVVYLASLIATYGEGGQKLSTDAETPEETGEALGTAVGLLLLLPHLALVLLAVIFNAIGWIGKFRWAALTAAILYTVGGVLGLVRIIFLIVPMVLCYVAYGKSKSETQK